LTCDVLPHRLAARHDMRFSLDRRLVPAGHPGGKADPSSAELQSHAALLCLSNRDNHEWWRLEACARLCAGTTFC
jgi:hypothetical protein